MAAATSRLLLRARSSLSRLYRTTTTSSSASSFTPHRVFPASSRCRPLGLSPFRALALFSSSASETAEVDGSVASPTEEETKVDGLGAGLDSENLEPLEMRKGDWKCPECNFINYSGNVRCLKCKGDGPTKKVNFQSGEMKKGDWICPRCEFMNFARNLRCLQCKADRTRDDGFGNVIVKKGDWHCPKCNFVNFARNVRCLECNAEKGITFDNLLVKKGDWNCPKCQFMNFARNTKCLQCQELRPKRELNPGEWECPSCKFLNFRRNEVCLKCKHDRPEDISSGQVEQNSKLDFEKAMSLGDAAFDSNGILTLLKGDTKSEGHKSDTASDDTSFSESDDESNGGKSSSTA